MGSKDFKDFDVNWKKMIAKMMLKTGRTDTLGTYICEGLVILEQTRQMDERKNNEHNT